MKDEKSYFLLAQVKTNHLQTVNCSRMALCLILRVIPVFSSICLCLLSVLD